MSQKNHYLLFLLLVLFVAIGCSKNSIADEDTGDDSAGNVRAGYTHEEASD